MKQYPMPFNVSAQSVSGIQTTWLSQAEQYNLDLKMAIPKEFDGPGGGLSPEDLFAMALQNCFVATFKVFAEKSKLVYSNITIHSTLDVDRNESGAPWMARIKFRVQLKGATQPENALRILEKTSKSCMILNSVKTEKSFEFELVE